MKKGAHAGNLIKAVASIVGGAGGGPSEYGAGRRKAAEKIPEAIAKVPEVLEGQIKA